MEVSLQGDTFSGLFFQDGLVKSTFAAFPVLLLINATYKLNDLRLYLMMCVDGNGNSEIVS